MRLDKVRDTQEGGSEGCCLILVSTFWGARKITFMCALELRVTPRGVWDWDWRLWSFWETQASGVMHQQVSQKLHLLLQTYCYRLQILKRLE